MSEQDERRPAEGPRPEEGQGTGPAREAGDVIRLLPDQVINQIAAGEVVERPASVLKELLDNALDAGARNIQVDVVDGGRRLVRVRDDGKGMDRANALMSLERHATSKLRSLADLDSLTTMGFRGEALAAISSVSQFTMVTNQANSVAGTEIVVFGGKVQEVRDAGAPPGTDIAVRNLFFNVPARRRFLRSATTEFTHIRQQFFLETLARPDVAFVLRADDEEVYRLPPAEDLRERVRDFLGDEVADALREVSHGDGIVEVGGWAGVPPYHRSDRELQVFLVNGRPAGSSVLSYAVQAAYRDVLPAGRYAPLFLLLTLPQEQLDVNVHPAKKEVRFRRPVEVRDVLIEALRMAIRGNELGGQKFAGRSGFPMRDPRGGQTPPTRDFVLPKAPDASSPGPLPSFAAPSATPGPAPFVLVPEAPKLLPEQGKLGLGFAAGAPTLTAAGAPRGAAEGEADGSRNRGRGIMPGDGPATSLGSPPADGPASAPVSAGPVTPWQQYRLLGRIADTYAVLETADGMVLVDPRSAHERVLYERWMAAIHARKVPSQGLLAPATVRLSPRQAHALRRQLDWFDANGFGISDFGADTFLVDALPSWLAEADPAALLSDMADVLLQGGRGSETDWIGPFVADIVSRQATGLHQRLDDAALHALIRALAETEMPYTSPRGRPTAILLSIRELNRKFHRES